MGTEQDRFALPRDLPAPADDGACAHLTNLPLPSLSLPSTSSSTVDVSSLSGLTILFAYPRTGEPGKPVPAQWDAIPGARGCTPQACSFRDLSKQLLAAGVNHMFGLSTQDTAYQLEAKERLHLPYQLLSDEELEFAKACRLPTFEYDGMTLIKRLAVAVLDGKIVKYWYPVFPSERNAADVLEWLEKEWTGRETGASRTEEKLFDNLHKK